MGDQTVKLMQEFINHDLFSIYDQDLKNLQKITRKDVMNSLDKN